MTIQQLREILDKDLEKQTDIEFEDYKGNTIFKLSELNYADSEIAFFRFQI